MVKEMRVLGFLAALSALLAAGDHTQIATSGIARPPVQSDRASIASIGSGAATTLAAPQANWMNALQHGVVGDGVTDDGPAIRSLFANVTGKTIFFPPNRTYLINTNVPPKVATVGLYPAMDNAGFIISNQSNFHVIANGATFKVTSAIPLTVTALIERGRDWTWIGGTFVGNRTGLKPDQENAAIAIINNVRFRVTGIRATGFGGNGAAFVGDWNIAGELSNLHLDGVGICFDLAFSKQLSIRNVVAVGADTNGARGAGHVGNKCYSEVNDTYYAKHNHTGVRYSQTDTVSLENLDASNFNTGVAVSAGRHYRFTNVRLHDNPGTPSRNIPGLGYYFYYTKGGPFTSAGSPVTDVRISGGEVANNGAANRGTGLLVEAPVVAGGDVLSGFTVSGVRFQNNAGTGIAIKGSAVATVGLTGNSYSGPRQTTNVDPNAARLSSAASRQR
jgi:hypothetical protein